MKTHVVTMWTEDSIENRYRFAFGCSNERNKSTKKTKKQRREHISKRTSKTFSQNTRTIACEALNSSGNKRIF